MKTLIFALIVIASAAFVSGCGSIVPAAAQTPGEKAQTAVAPPRLIAVWFDGPAKWVPERGRYEFRIYVKLKPTTDQLFLIIKNHWKNQNGEGVIVHEPRDFTQWAAGGSFFQNRTLGLPGTYIFTVTVRNSAGEDSITLPPFIVK
jgi:hypothetical protein